MMSSKQVVSAFWQGMPPVWAKYRRRAHNDCPADLRMEFADFVDMLQRDGHISETVAASVTLDSGRRTR